MAKRKALTGSAVKGLRVSWYISVTLDRRNGVKMKCYNECEHRRT